MKRIIVSAIIAITLFSCKKEMILPTDPELVNPTKDEQAVLFRKNHNPHSDPVTHKACFLLDFDGYDVSGIWGNVSCSGSGNVDISNIISRVKNYWSQFDVEITTNETLYNTYPVYKRMRVVITTTNFYGNVGGVAYINSLNWIDQEKQCFVFSSLLYYNSKYISDATAHEMGHTANCYHHKDIIHYEDGSCFIRSEYLLANHIMANCYSFSNPIFTTGEMDCGVFTVDPNNINNALNQ